MTTQIKKALWVGVLAFAVGVGAGAVGYKQVVSAAKKRQNEAAEKLPSYNRDAELLRGAFVDPLAAGEAMVNPPVKSPAELSPQIQAICSMPLGAFFDAVNRREVRVVSWRQAQPDRVVVSYELGQPREAWAYCRQKDSAARAERAFLIIPGTGMNESSKIFLGDPKDYHGDIAAQAGQYGDIFVLVKPNEDFLAIHDGGKKLSYDYIINHLLNAEESYSARYLADSLALSQHLKSRYKAVYVVGLSQGGTAALFNAMVSSPTGALVASGYSTLTSHVDCSGYKQIVIPDVAPLFSAESVRKRLAELPTRFVFSYGRGERGAYRVEAMEGVTAKRFEGLSNVRFVVHGGGHAFAPDAIGQLLKEKP